MKKILSLLLVFLMIFSLVSCANDTVDDNDNGGNDPDDIQDGDGNDEPAVDDSQIIDIYIIAGQSNAAGCTNITNKTQAYTWAPELESGFSNVHYAGNSRRDANGYKVLYDRDVKWQPTILGLGILDTSIGPEAGMAKGLSEYYNADTGKNAGIIKFAHGGTSIRNITSNSNKFGNWVSPSYAKSLGVEYKGATGGLYRGLLAQVKKNISELEEYGGFIQINIKGLYWMQGEADLNSISEYEKAFKYFASDIRDDLADIMLEFTDGKSDCGASDMAIFIGSISRTFNLSNKNTETSVNVPFINMQKKLAENIKNCYFVDNSGYAITRWDSAAQKQVVLGSDKYHWNMSDMLEIGKNVGKAMIEKCTKNEVVKWHKNTL